MKNMTKARNSSLAFLLVLFIFVADQLSKAWAVRVLKDTPDFIPVVDGIFGWSYTTNTGAIFGIFEGFAKILAVVGLLSVVALYWWRSYFRLHQSLSAIAWGSFVGGVLGNTADRLLRGKVIDFVDLNIWILRPPSFNVADVAISLGACLLVCLSFYPQGQKVDS